MTETPKTERRSITLAIESLLVTGARQSTVYQHPKLRVTATRRHRPNKRSTITEIVLTIGKPNFEQRAFIKACLARGLKFPSEVPRLKMFPAKKK